MVKVCKQNERKFTLDFKNIKIIRFSLLNVTLIVVNCDFLEAFLEYGLAMMEINRYFIELNENEDL